MLKHVLIPLDASPAAESVLSRFMPLLVRPDTEVVVLHVSTPPLAASMDPRRGDDVREEAQDYVRAIAGRLSGQGVRCRGVVKAGPAAEAIVATAAEKTNGMIAMATHGRTGLARLAFGSVAERVLRHSPVPVLLVRSAGEQAAGTALAVKRMMVPVDGSALALAVAPYVAELAKAFKAEVTLVHVLPPKPAQGETIAHAERVVAAAKERFQEEGVACEALIRTGDAAEEILDAVRQNRADLVACSTHGRTGIARAVLGSVAEKMMRMATVPLLVCRAAT
ncbi:MAG: universal stress protein [Planctomycetota bacterium]